MKIQTAFPSLLIALFALIAAAPLNAQTEKQPAQKGRVEKSERHRKHSEKMAKELNLTPEQQAQFKKIDEEHAVKAKSKRQARREESTQLRTEKHAQRKAVLTKEQAAKYDEMQAKKQAKHKAKKEKKGGRKSGQKVKKAENSEKKAIKEELDKQ